MIPPILLFSLPCIDGRLRANPPKVNLSIEFDYLGPFSNFKLKKDNFLKKIILYKVNREGGGREEEEAGDFFVL